MSYQVFLTLDFGLWTSDTSLRLKGSGEDAFHYLESDQEDHR